jgi:hypothetical protein
VTFGLINSRGATPASAGPGTGLPDEGGGGEDEEAPDFSTITVTDQQFNVALARRALMPLDKMFAVGYDSPETRNPLGNNRWAKQSYAFVHMCLYGEGGRWQKPFGQFLQRMGNSGPTEALFQECFGISYKKMLTHLRGYIGFTSHKYQQFVLKDGDRFTAPPPDVQPATEAQIARIKGDALRLAGHREAAHNAYRAAYIRGEREPRLLAALGVEEVAAGRADRGRKLLEAAAKSGFDRPTGYIELAKLRLAEASANPAGADGKLSPAQVASVIEILASGQRRPPPLPESYGLAAATWAAAEVPPTREQLKALDAGIALFPRYASMVMNAAVLNARAGAPEHAVKLAQHGIQIAPDPATKARFEQLLATLSSAAPAPAAVPPK